MCGVVWELLGVICNLEPYRQRTLAGGWMGAKQKSVPAKCIRVKEQATANFPLLFGVGPSAEPWASRVIAARGSSWLSFPAVPVEWCLVLTLSSTVLSLALGSLFRPNPGATRRPHQVKSYDEKGWR